MNYHILRLGKDSVDNIRLINQYSETIRLEGDNVVRISVTCTQLPDILAGDISFICLGSDNSKGQATDWKLGLRAIGRITHVSKAASYNQESTIEIDVTDVFSESLSREDLVLADSGLLPGIINMPIIGLNAYANQTVQTIRDGEPGQSVEALLGILAKTVGLSIDLDTKPFQRPLPRKRPISQIGQDMIFPGRSKPFLILAGPSGTGKSRWVRQKAYQTWNGAEKPLTPPNYKLIPVKPNWHDSSDLLGYVTRLGLKASESPKFVVTDFVRFLVEAWKSPKMPFWLCLDEMNLAPVEQYFAEYLSVVETRKVVGDSILTDALIPPSAFLDVDWTDFCKHVGLEPTDRIAEMIKSDGLSLPPNLIVVGTVNMDETTHSFSRKVLDRAFVWEMPIGDLDEGWDPLVYPEATPSEWRPLLATGGDEARQKLDAEYGDLPEAWLETTDTTKAVVAWLKKVNEVLEGTPFKVSYRVRDELLLLALAHEVATVDALQKMLDDGLYSKILPRIEGDVVRTQKALAGLGKLLLDFAGLADAPEWSQIFPADSGQELDFQRLSNAPSGPKFMFGTESWPTDPFAPALPWRRSLNKIRSMLLKLEGQFTSYWD